MTASPRPSARPRLWTVALAFALALGLQIGSGVVLVVLAIVTGRVPVSSPATAQRDVEAFAFSFSSLSVSVVFSSTLLTSISLLGAHLSPSPWRERLRLVPFHGGPLAVASLSLAVWTLGIAESSLTSLVHPRADWSGAQIGRAIHAMAPWQVAVMGALMGLVTPVAEELFFRGYLQTRLRERWGRWPAIVIASALFGVFHLDPTHALVAFGLGLVLGWACEATSSVVPGIVMHMVNNLIAVAGSSGGSHDEGASRGATLARLLLAASVAALSLLAARRLLRRAPTLDVTGGQGW